MSRRTRGLLTVPLGAAILAGLIAAAAGLPSFGHGTSAYGAWVARQMVPARGTTDVVAPVVFDVRALDTLGEELILFSAAAACVLFLRTLVPAERDRGRRLRDLPAIDVAPVRALARLLLPATVVLGAYIVAHGQISPGGGFQGGVVLAALALLAVAAGRAAGVRHQRTTSAVEVAEAFGAGAFVLLGIGGLVFATAAFENFLGKGSPGELISGGTIPLANIAVGIEVTAAFALIFVELLQSGAEGGEG
jgi:multicomponent Na+:H+ antiporter subunit B